MPLTSLILLFILFLAFIFIVVGVAFQIKNKNMLNKPSIVGISSLILEVLLFVLFFNEILPRFNETFAYILWIGVVIYGLISGIREFKNNIIVSLVSIYLSILLGILMLLLRFITSM